MPCRYEVQRRYRSSLALCGGGGSSLANQDATFAGVIGSSTSSMPSASATAFARQTGVLMVLPSPTPFAPSGVNGEGDSMCRIVGAGTSHAVGTR